MVYLTICIPTRNRQRYCIEAIKAIAASEGTDFDVIVADNSDDPEIMKQFFANEFSDSRFRLLPSRDQVLSMIDNWERTMEEVTGRWVSFIGDDDHIDPRVVGLLRRYEREHKDVDAVGWSRMHYSWPDNRLLSTLAIVPCAHDTHIASKALLQDHLYKWSERSKRPSCGFGIYHGALRRSLMEKIKRKCGNRYFEHPTVDFENSCKVIHLAKKLIYCQRPFSVLGACAASNSAVTQSFEVEKQRVQQFLDELGDGMQVQGDDFPFSPFLPGLSILSGIASTTWWYCCKYGLDKTGFEENFAHSATEHCLASRNIEEYEIKVAGLRIGFDLWQGGKWAHLFNPPAFNPPVSHNSLTGVYGKTIYVRESALDAATPGDFYNFAQSFVMPAEHVISDRRAFAA
jgi:glycosyltransferase involved in cell wall biosynthesis